MSGTLSAKFAQLKAAPTKVTVNKTVKVQQAISSQKYKRTAQTDARRNSGVGIATKPENKGRQAARNGRPSSRTNVNKTRANSGRKGGRKEKKEAPKTAMDLDTEMDKYWFAAGKGKNPDLISLDREMDDYFKSKTTKTSSEEVAVSATIDTTPSVAV